MMWFYLGGGQYLNLLDIREMIDNSIRLSDGRWLELEEEQADKVIVLLADYEVM